MTFCFDIDGTLCETPGADYQAATPIAEAIADVNRPHRAGHRILLFTARGSTTGIDWRELTESQMRAWGVDYDELILGKPTADVFIDDRAINAADWRRAGYSVQTAMERSR